MKYFTMTLLTTALLTGTAIASQTAPVITGGVGDTNQEALEQVENYYSLKLVFTDEQGAYLADVAVSIRDQSGVEVANGYTDGPLLLAALEPGRYTVEAVAEGFNKKRTVRVGESLKTYHIQFPIKGGGSNMSLIDRLEDEGYDVHLSFPG